MKSSTENLEEHPCNNNFGHDRLVRITDMVQEVDDYAASVKEVTGELGNSDNTTLIKIRMLREILENQKQTLKHAIDQYCVCRPDLAEAVKDAQARTATLEVRLDRLMWGCCVRTDLTLQINERTDEVLQRVRAQIAKAMDVVYS